MEDLQYQYSIGNFKNVIRIANDLLKQDKYHNDYSVLMHKAFSYNELLEDKNAIKSFSEIIDIFPLEVEPKNELSLILIRIGEFSEAREILESARKIEPNDLIVINNLIYIEEQLLDFDKVLILANEAIAIDDKDASLWLTKAEANDRLGNYNEAIKNGMKAVELSDDDEIYLQMAYNGLGYTYSKVKDFTNAELYLKKAIQVDDSEPFQYNNLGWVYAQKGEIDKGLKLINKSIRIDPNNSYAYKNRGKVYLLSGETKLAKRDLLLAKELDYDLNYDGEVNELLRKLS